MSDLPVMPWAWGVRYPDDTRALFTDYGRAIQAAAHRRGVVVPLYAQPPAPGGVAPYGDADARRPSAA